MIEMKIVLTKIHFPDSDPTRDHTKIAINIFVLDTRVTLAPAIKNKTLRLYVFVAN